MKIAFLSIHAVPAFGFFARLVTLFHYKFMKVLYNRMYETIIMFIIARFIPSPKGFTHMDA